MSKSRVTIGVLVALSGVMCFAGCRASEGAEGATPAAQRATIADERAKTLQDLYAARPETRDKIRSAPGYAFFSTVNLNLLVLSTENGYGVVHENKPNLDTYMKMGSAGVGLGMGVKDMRVVFIFTDPSVMRRFIDKGWDFAGQADAAAKNKDSGGAAGAAASGTSVAGMEIYQFTEKGLALQATLQGTKYWRDEKLNK